MGVGPSSLAEGVAVPVDEVLGEAPRGEDALAVDPREYPPELGRLAIKGLPPLPFPNRGRVETVELVEQRVHLGQPLCVPGLERGGVPEIRQLGRHWQLARRPGTDVAVAVDEQAGWWRAWFRRPSKACHPRERRLGSRAVLVLVHPGVLRQLGIGQYEFDVGHALLVLLLRWRSEHGAGERGVQGSLALLLAGEVAADRPEQFLVELGPE